MATPSQSISDAKSRSFGERAFAITPVILTLLGTALAGLSSSEMTKAQYHRTLAAQNQAKASDQWNLFQFKRTRRMLGEETVALFQGVAGRIEPADLEATTHRIAALLVRGRKEADTLQHLPARPALEKIRRAARHLEARAGALSHEADEHVTQVHQELSRPEVREDLAYLGTNKLPPSQEQPIADAEIVRAQEAARAGTLETQDAVSLVRMPQAHLHAALAIAEANTVSAAVPGKETDRRLRKLDALVEQQRQAIYAFHRAATAVDESALDVSDSEPQSASVVESARAIRRTDTALQRAAGELNIYRIGREDYNARRNALEAAANEKTGQLYEVQVHKSNLTAERYRTRSGRFFYGMLLAQAGAAIASLALAARQQSVLWGVAGIAGVAAIALTGYVYLVL